MVRTDEEDAKRLSATDNANPLPTDLVTPPHIPAATGLGLSLDDDNNHTTTNNCNHVSSGQAVVLEEGHSQQELSDHRNDNVAAGTAGQAEQEDIMTKSTIENNNDISKVDNEQYQRPATDGATQQQSALTAVMAKNMEEETEGGYM